MPLIGLGTEVGIDEGNQFVDEHALERAEIESRRAASSWGGRGRAGLGRSRWPRRTHLGAGDVATGHHDDEWLALAGSDQIVHDRSGFSLVAPACLVFSRAVLQVKHRIPLRRIL